MTVMIMVMVRMTAIVMAVVTGVSMISDIMPNIFLSLRHISAVARASKHMVDPGLRIPGGHADARVRLQAQLHGGQHSAGAV